MAFMTCRQTLKRNFVFEALLGLDHTYASTQDVCKQNSKRVRPKIAIFAKCHKTAYQWILRRLTVVHKTAMQGRAGQRIWPCSTVFHSNESQVWWVNMGNTQLLGPSWVLPTVAIAPLVCTRQCGSDMCLHVMVRTQDVIVVPAPAALVWAMLLCCCAVRLPFPSEISIA